MRIRLRQSWLYFVISATSLYQVFTVSEFLISGVRCPLFAHPLNGKFTILHNMLQSDCYNTGAFIQKSQNFQNYDSSCIALVRQPWYIQCVFHEKHKKRNPYSWMYHLINKILFLSMIYKSVKTQKNSMKGWPSTNSLNITSHICICSR